MDIDNAANILAGSILTCLAIVIVVITVVIINNILHKYWKPVTLWKYESPSARFASQEELERIAPVLDEQKKV